MRTNNRLLLSLLVPLTLAGQSNVWALSIAPEAEQPYKQTFQITGKEGGGYSITAVVKPAGAQGMPLSVIQPVDKRLPGTGQPPTGNPPDDKTATTDKDDKAGKKPPTEEKPNTAQQPVTKQEVEDLTNKMAEQLQKQQEELAKQLQKQQEELAKQLQKQQEEAAQKMAQQQQEVEKRLQQQQQQAQQRMAQAQQQANQQLANQQQQLANQLAQQQAQNAQQQQQQLAQLAQQQQQMAQAQMAQQQQQQRQLGRLFAQARRDQMMRNFEQAMFGNPNLMNQMNPNTAQGIMGLVNQMMQTASQMAGQMRGGQGQQDGQQNQQVAQGPTAQEIAAELQKLIGDKLSTDAAEKVLAALQESAKSPSPQALSEQMQEFTDLGNKLQPSPESPSRVSSASDDLSVGPNDYEGLAKLADKLAKGDHRMTKQFLEMSLDAAGRVSGGGSYTSAEKQKARQFALNLVSRFKGLKEQMGSSSASERSMRSALEFDIDKCMRINNETA